MSNNFTIDDLKTHSFEKAKGDHIIKLFKELSLKYQDFYKSGHFSNEKSIGYYQFNFSFEHFDVSLQLDYQGDRFSRISLLVKKGEESSLDLEGGSNYFLIAKSSFLLFHQLESLIEDFYKGKISDLAKFCMLISHEKNHKNGFLIEKNKKGYEAKVYQPEKELTYLYKVNFESLGLTVISFNGKYHTSIEHELINRMNKRFKIINELSIKLCCKNVGQENYYNNLESF